MYRTWTVLSVMLTARASPVVMGGAMYVLLSDTRRHMARGNGPGHTGTVLSDGWRLW